MANPGIRERLVIEDNPYFLLLTLVTARGLVMRECCEAGDCASVRINDSWHAWINPHQVDSGPDGTTRPVLPPLSAFITYNGWPWSVCDPYGGGWHGTHPDPAGATLARFAADVVSAAVAEGLDSASYVEMVAAETLAGAS